MIDYAAISRRIDSRASCLSVTAPEGLSPERFAQLRKDATGISTLEATDIATALCVPIPWLLLGER
jgi:hypothetical protein